MPSFCTRARPAACRIGSQGSSSARLTRVSFRCVPAAAGPCASRFPRVPRTAQCGAADAVTPRVCRARRQAKDKNSRETNPPQRPCLCRGGDPPTPVCGLAASRPRPGARARGPRRPLFSHWEEQTRRPRRPSRRRRCPPTAATRGRPSLAGPSPTRTDSGRAGGGRQARARLSARREAPHGRARLAVSSVCERATPVRGADGQHSPPPLRRGLPPSPPRTPPFPPSRPPAPVPVPRGVVPVPQWMAGCCVDAPRRRACPTRSPFPLWRAVLPSARRPRAGRSSLLSTPPPATRRSPAAPRPWPLPPPSSSLTPPVARGRRRAYPLRATPLATATRTGT